MNHQTNPSYISQDRLENITKHIKENYIKTNKYIGTITAVYKNDKLVFVDIQGLQDRERNIPLKRDSIFRIYSMTKPITSVAMMTLYESGKFQLDDPVHKYIPSWKNLKIYKSGKFPDFQTTDYVNTMTIRDLLSHQSGLTYGFQMKSEIDKAYRENGIGRMESLNTNQTLSDMIDQLKDVPLEFEPSTAWNYSVSTDVLGYLIELISDNQFDEYLHKNIFNKLNMKDTDFFVPKEKLDRFTSNYLFNMGESFDGNGTLPIRQVDRYSVQSGDPILIDDSQMSLFSRKPAFLSGGGGLVSTLDDYINFSVMLLNEGKFKDSQILSNKTIDLMTSNHLFNNKDLLSSTHANTASETTMSGVGFGLGFQILLNPAKNQINSSIGEYGWGGAASTTFWIDPSEKLITVFLTQLIPSTTYNIRRELRTLVYSSLTK
ncbi:MAG: serine hydrolase [Candidatus Marinimicrobia bacterium]|nr:serine hydrolase [Candidatus Neomarinimicrobiota bacterium]|tara:strand:+ start:261 stop:1556 length:1296 start_codon:yes stop_codon:yes gene_type:complete